MDRSRKLFGVLEVSFENICDETNTLLKKQPTDVEKIYGNGILLDEKVNLLKQLHEKVIEAMLDESVDEKELLLAVQRIDQIVSRYTRLKYLVGQCLNKDTESSSNPKPKTGLNLPKIKFVTFGGDIGEWLNFWAQFKRIDDNVDMALEDKFQYLIQATIVNSRARQLVESYPPTGENYPKVIEAFKSRFGREDLLIDYYVRELLRLVLGGLHKKRGLTQLYDSIESQLRSLETLSVTKDKCAAMLYPLVESCLPEEVLRVWQRSNGYNVDSNLEDRLEELMNFLRKEVEAEERISLAVSGFDVEKKKVLFQQKNSLKFNVTASGLLNQRKEVVCIFCNKNHLSSDCTDTENWTPDLRSKKLLEKNRCLKCTRAGHIAKNCHVRIFCLKCKGRHASVLCKKATEDVRSTEITRASNHITSVEDLSNGTKDQTFLQTLVVQVVNGDQWKYARAIIDTGSQRSYIFQQLATELGYIPNKEESIIHALFGGVESKIVHHHVYKINLRSMDNKYTCNFDVLDQAIICSNVICVKDGPWIEELSEHDISVTDKQEGPIEILIGADVCGRIFTGRKCVLTCGLVALQTKLGWILMGKIPRGSNDAMIVTSSLCLNANIQNLWRLDIIGITSPEEDESAQRKHQDAMLCFLNDVKVNDQGRYEVGLIWSNDHPPLSSNFIMAKKRLYNLIIKLNKDGYYHKYNEVFTEWLNEGIIEEIAMDDNIDKVGHYLPHRHVVKLSSATTKLRPVFDASAKLAGSPSLNQCLEKCVNLIELIPSIFMRFRCEKIGVTSDIRKAFLQISLKKDDRDFLRFLWYDMHNQLKVFRHKRVVFGVTCSPFLLSAVIQFHLEQTLAKTETQENSFSRSTLLKLSQSFYVDNCVTSVSSQDELNRFMSESVQIMDCGKFNLRCWEYTLNKDDELPQNIVSPVLGLNWNRKTDALLLNMDWFKDISFDVISKRTILSVAHRLFDPIGFSCPVQVVPRILLQKTWKNKFSWDEQLPEDIRHEFLKYLIFLNIPRNFQGETGLGLIHRSLHLFCDASKDAYAAVIFMRTESPSGVTIQLIAAKNRITPIKKLSIPRLELLAATIGVRVANLAMKTLAHLNPDLYCWTDSTTVLAWIQREDVWKPFVWNRIKEIKDTIKKENWYHVPGSMNPADLPPRGCSAKNLINSKWWEGPTWLIDIRKWPSQNYIVEEELVSEERKNTSISMLNNKLDQSMFLNCFSIYSHIVNILGWIYRFYNNCCNKNDKQTNKFITTTERETAQRILFKFIQTASFSGPVAKDIVSLQPFVDSDGLIRIKTRVFRREDSPNFLIPILLPGKHPIVQKMILEQHIKNGHAGVLTLLTILRQEYWIIRGRKAVKGVLAKCVLCRRFDAKKFETPLTQLPSDRVKDARVFQIVGVDLAGPLFLKDGNKVWICLFTCAIYRAVHLEFVTDCSTESFVQGFRRFIARRGRPAVIYSDNGTNFVGYVNAVNNLDWDKIHKYRQILRKVLGRACLTYESLQTIVCDCESLINSRPITYLYDVNKELLPLSPSLFLQDSADYEVPDLDKLEMKRGFMKKHYERKQHLMKCLRKRFRDEYLGQLRVYGKQTARRGISNGEIVLISNDQAKRLDWPLAIVEDMFMGKDGVVRMVKVRTAKGSLYRPVQRLYPLEIFSNEEQQQLHVQSADLQVQKMPSDQHQKSPSHEITILPQDTVDDNTKLPQTETEAQPSDSDQIVSDDSEEKTDVGETSSGAIQQLTRFGRKIVTPKRLDL